MFVAADPALGPATTRPAQLAELPSIASPELASQGSSGLCASTLTRIALACALCYSRRTRASATSRLCLLVSLVFPDHMCALSQSLLVAVLWIFAAMSPLQAETAATPQQQVARAAAMPAVHAAFAWFRSHEREISDRQLEMVR